MFLLSLFLTLGAAGPRVDGGLSARAAFEEALAAEGRSTSEAAARYRELVARHAGSPFAGEALMRLAAIADDIERDPPEALRLYRLYLAKEPAGRLGARAAARIAALARHEHVDPALYREYLRILEGRDRARAVREMRELIDAHAGFAALDDALLWLANEVKGARSRSGGEEQRAAAREALPIYERLLREFPASRHRLAALKNLGDVHLALGAYGKAARYYHAVREEGGEEGAVLTKEFSEAAAVKLGRKRLLYLALALIPLALLALAWEVPFRRAHRRAALLGGLRHALFVLPAAILAVGAALALTTPGKGTHTGAEPPLVAACMGALLAFTFANGAIIRIDERERVNAGIYLPALAVLVLAALYGVLYGLDLLTPFDRMLR